MNYAYLITGSNMDNPTEQLALARKQLQDTCGPIIDISSMYETEPWGNPDQAAFFNQVLVIETPVTPQELLQIIGNIEHKMGRERKEKNGPRVIDIDILFFNHQIINQPGLRVPHPELPNRRFVLEPLNQVAPAYIHPVLYKTVRQLLNECADPLTVKKSDA